jgi:HrpA-like RNA helicase
MGLLRDDKITQLGLIVNDIGLDPRFALSCIIGKKLRCLNEILAVCSCLEAGKNNINEFFRFPSEIVKIDEFSSDEDKEAKKGQIKSLNKKFKKALSKFNTKYGDITSLLKIFVEVYSRYDRDGHRFGDKTSDICYKYFLNPTAWIKACSYYDKYMRTIRNVLRSTEEIKELIDLDMAVKVNTCFYYSFKNNYVELYDNKFYKNSKINVKNINLNEDSFNYDDKLPKELYYIELIKNFGKYEIGITSKISDSTKKIYNIVSKNI